MNTTRPANQLSQNTLRGPSEAVWKGKSYCPVRDFIEDPNQGMYFFDDFLVIGSGPSATGGAIAQSNGQWASYVYQGGTVIDGAKEGGVITIASDGDNEGVAFSSGAGAFRLVTTSTKALNRRLWFEARVSLSTITATKNDAFIGLFDGFLTSGLPTAAWPIQTTDDTLAAAMNAIGFQRKGSVGTDWSFLYQLSGQTTVYPTNLTTLTTTVLGTAMAAADFVKLGFVFDPIAEVKVVGSASTGQTAGTQRRALVRVFVNGLEAAAFLTSDNLGGTAFPTGFMAPGFAIMNQTGSTPGTMSVDWIRVAQEANS